LCIARERFAAVFNVIFVVGGSVFTERSPVKAVLDHLSGKFEGNRLGPISY
jgi:hypothetical protein